MLSVITALSWAVLAIVLKYSLHFLDSGTIVWSRLVIATLALGLLLGLFRPSDLQILKRLPFMAVAAGGLIAVNYFGFMKGIELTSASHAQVMIQMAPLGLAVVGWFYFKEPTSFQQMVGFFIAILGFGLFFWDQILVSWLKLSHFQWGSAWVVLAAMMWIVFASLQKILLKSGVQPQQFNLVTYGVSSLCLLPVAEPLRLMNLDGFQWSVVVFLGLNTVVAYGALSEALQRIPSSHVSMVITLNPLLTVLIMTFLTRAQVSWISGEPVYWRGFLGAIFVVVGVVLAVRRPPSQMARIKTS